MDFDKLYAYVESFTSNDWRQVAIQFDVPKNPKYIPVIDALKSLYPDYSKTEAAHLVRTKTKVPPTCECGKQIAFRNDPKPYYPIYCSLKCKNSFSNTQAEPIIIDGIHYAKFTDAIVVTGLNRNDIRTRIFDPEYPSYVWDCNDHNQKCIEKLHSHHPKLIDKNFLLEWKHSGMSQSDLCNTNGFESYQLRYALLFFGIDSKFDQVNPLAREFLNDKTRFCSEFETHSMERLAVIYQVSTGTIRNYARSYGLDTSMWSLSISKAETEVYLFVKELFQDAQQSCRDFFGKNGKELDIFIPSLNIGIEFNGVFTHSDMNKDKTYHREKHMKFRDIGVRYIQLWEDDWTYRNEKVKQFLINALGKNTNRIGARETSVREISQEEMDLFLNANHMQGKTKCKHRLGLFKDGSLLSVMGFRELPTQLSGMYANGIGIDLARFANTTVTGAFTKLLTHFEKTHAYDYVLSYADLEIVSPFKNVYSTNGFTVVKEIKEDYRYFNSRTKVREHKFNWRKETFSKLGIDINGKTEFELANELGLLRCYDSGKILYIRPTKYKSPITTSDAIALDC